MACKKYLKLLRGLFYEGWKSGVAKVFSSPKNSARDSKKSSPEKRKSSLSEKSLPRADFGEDFGEDFGADFGNI